jgi:hypothetical protein
MKTSMFCAALMMTVAVTPVALGQGKVEVKSTTWSRTCTVDSMELSADGILRIRCTDIADVSAAPPPVSGDTGDRAGAASSSPSGDGPFLGQGEDGSWWTAAEELSGQVKGALYIPSLENYHTIVHDGGNPETVYPGCAGIIIDNQRTWRDCKLSGSLEAGITYAQRLRVTDALPEYRVEMKTRETGDKLGTYDYAIAEYPGDLEPANRMCKAKSAPGATFYFQSWACSTPLKNLGDGKLKMYYASFKPVGQNAARCGSGLTCRMYMRAW